MLAYLVFWRYQISRKNKAMNRRTFVKNTSLVTAGFAVLPTANIFAAPDPVVRLGFIGVGLRGQNHLDNALRRKDVNVVAICDIDDRMLERAGNLFKKAGKPLAKVFKGDVQAW